MYKDVYYYGNVSTYQRGQLCVSEQDTKKFFPIKLSSYKEKHKSMADENKKTFISSVLGVLGLKRAKHNEDIPSVTVEDAIPVETREDKKVIKAIKKVNKKEIAYKEKYKAKHQAKRTMKKRFKVGKKYFLRIKPKDGSREVVRGYVCKKFIYTMNDMPMNIVIMKQFSGEETKKFTLDRHECTKFHVKFEPGLEVWSMNLNWIPEKKVEKM